MIRKSLQFAPDWKFYFDVRGGGEIVKSCERGGNGDWEAERRFIPPDFFSYSFSDRMSGINLLNIYKFAEKCDFTLVLRSMNQIDIYVLKICVPILFIVVIFKLGFQQVGTSLFLYNCSSTWR